MSVRLDGVAALDPADQLSPVAAGANRRLGAWPRTAASRVAIAEEHLKFLAASDPVRLGAVCALSPALAKVTGERHGARSAWTDVAEMLGEVQPDVAHVLTPPRTHPALVRRSPAASAHVSCEKPLAPSSAALDLRSTAVEVADLVDDDPPTNAPHFRQCRRRARPDLIMVPVPWHRQPLTHPNDRARRLLSWLTSRSPAETIADALH